MREKEVNEKNKNCIILYTPLFLQVLFCIRKFLCKVIHHSFTHFSFLVTKSLYEIIGISFLIINSYHLFFTDYIMKLKIIDELLYQINEGKADKNIIKNKLEAIQDECSKLSNKLKDSACMLDEVQTEKNKLELEKKTFVI